MSAIRGCDTCGEIFFETSEDWAGGTVTVRVKDKETGRTRLEEIDQDQCGVCRGSKEGRRPNREGNTFPGDPATYVDKSTKAIQNYDPAKVEELEAENLRLIKRQNELLHGVNLNED